MLSTTHLNKILKTIKLKFGPRIPVWIQFGKLSPVPLEDVGMGNLTDKNGREVLVLLLKASYPEEPDGTLNNETLNTELTS
jgi:hypothetical protein